MDEETPRIKISHVENLFINEDGELDPDVFEYGVRLGSRRSRSRGINRKLDRIKKQAKKLYYEIEREQEQIQYKGIYDDLDEEEM
jgi:hypothetical protein